MRWKPLAMVAALGLVTACGQPVDGTPVAGAPSLEDQFDPCTIPDDAIAATGLDPGSRLVSTDAGITTTGWKMCAWDGPTSQPWYSYQALFSLQSTLLDVRNNTDYTDFEETTVGTRSAVSFRLRMSDAKGICDIAFDTVEGIAIFFASRHSSDDAHREDLCEVVRAHTADLEMYLPPS